MAKLLSPAQPAELTTPAQLLAPEERRRVFLLRVPTVYDRAILRRAIAMRSGRSHSQMEMLLALKRGIETLLSGEADAAARGNLTAQVDTAVQLLMAWWESDLTGANDGEEGAAARDEAWRSAQEQIKALGEIAELVRDADPNYAAMDADNQVYRSIQGLEAARLFLVGWRNGPAPFARDPVRGVPENLLALIDDYDLLAIGEKVVEMMAPTETERKNSASPSPGNSTETPSPAASTTDQTTLSPTTPGSSPKSDGPS